MIDCLQAGVLQKVQKSEKVFDESPKNVDIQNVIAKHINV